MIVEEGRATDGNGGEEGLRKGEGQLLMEEGGRGLLMEAVGGRDGGRKRER